MVKAISYILTDAIYNFIYSSGDTVRRKLDILSSIISIIRGVVIEDEELDKIEEELNFLIQNYEPLVDLDAFGIAFEKANSMNKKIYELFGNVIKLVQDYDLLELKVVQEVYARMWGDKSV